MKKQIRLNLEKLFNQNYDLVKDSSMDKLLAELAGKNPPTYDMDLAGTYFYSKMEIERIKEAQTNEYLKLVFEQAKRMDIPYHEIIVNFTKDIKTSLEVIKEEVGRKNKDYKNQIIIIEYDYEPIAYFCGFGPGEYPILEVPMYLESDFKEQLYNGVGGIDYSILWKDIILLEELLDDLGLLDLIWRSGSKVYDSLKEAYKFKTYLLLFDTFDKLGFELFNGIPTQKPLYIYGNEHDCEAINIYVYE